MLMPTRIPTLTKGGKTSLSFSCQKAVLPRCQGSHSASSSVAGYASAARPASVAIKAIISAGVKDATVYTQGSSAPSCSESVT